MKRRMISLGLMVLGLLLGGVPHVQGQPAARPEILGQIVYSGADVAGVYQIFVLDLAVDRSTALTTGTAASYLPKWSPDGQFISYLAATPSDFEAVPGLAQSQDKLYVMNADGSNPAALTDGTFRLQSTPLGWSPDSQYYVFASFFEDAAQQVAEGDVYIIRRDGTSLTPLQITYTDKGATAGGWTANGQVVVLENEIFQFVAPDGTRQASLPVGAYYALQPNHTSTALTIVDNQAGLEQNEHWIGTLDLTTGEAALIAPLFDPLGVVYSAVWSPTGAHVAVSMERFTPDTNESLGFILAVLEVATGSWVTLDGADVSVFDWSPDGRILAFNQLDLSGAAPMIYGYDTVTGGTFPIVAGTHPDWR